MTFKIAYFILPHTLGTPKSFWGVLSDCLKNAKLS